MYPEFEYIGDGNEGFAEDIVLTTLF